jgi:hypothetical protein
MKQHGLFMVLALAALGLIYFSRRAAAAPATATEQPGQAAPPLTGPDTIDTSSSPDLTGYPVHGAPAIPIAPGSLGNLLASYPSLITGTTALPQSSATAPATSASSALTLAQQQAAAAAVYRAGIQSQPQSPYFDTLFNAHASSEFGSNSFKLLDFLGKVASIPIVAVDYIGQSLKWGGGGGGSGGLAGASAGGASQEIEVDQVY